MSVRSKQDEQNLRDFGKRFAEVRKSKQITQQDLAADTNLSVVAIGYIETGKRWPRIGTLHKLAKTMGVKIEDLFKGL